MSRLTTIQQQNTSSFISGKKRGHKKWLHASLGILTLITIPFSHATTNGDELVTTAQDQKHLVVTIYNDNLALIKDTRQLILNRARNNLAWREVSAQIRPETALLRNLTAPTGFHLLEQNFDFDLLTPRKLLEKHIGKVVTVVRTHPTTGDETKENATILSVNEGVILKFVDRIENNPPGRIVFPGVPENLRDRPTLLISLISPSQGKHNLELSYLTEGLSWHADYVAALNEDDSHLDLNGLVTLTNQSGVAYPQAELQLVAGDVHRVQPARRLTRKTMAMAAEAIDAAQMKEESLFEYHLYTLQRPTTLADNQTKQVALMSAANIAVSKEYVLQGGDYYYTGMYTAIGQKLKTSVLVRFLNKGAGLGIPLPKGIIRVYKKDTQGNSQFIGEDQIDHTPRNEQVRLKLGNAFDVTADKVQTDFQQIAGTLRHTSIYETAYQITLRNAKKETITVHVREPIPGDWAVLSESSPHTKLSAGMAEWQIAVPAESEATLNYRVRVNY
ncbi:DUF4139 domain-containing protein [Nitrosomonas nitrosa]|uniref:DUF4139 domain-containing protein n=1 Tax=Nitrosomonas nitrosa TaxID=52442 RepID=UPI0023F987E9|nr:DUF4139 domain-containing protein [Nitrosomonas nitrosa]MCO6435223.1 DUF4139 domain-containing protein [Nitrosomonas nitrosa]